MIDQASKWWILHHTTNSAIVLTQNTGIAFGFFQNQTGLIIAINVVFLGAIWIFREKWFSASKWQSFALWFVLAGGVGNGFDRIARGYVVDFLQVGPIPTFNIADVWVNVGVVLLLIHFLINGLHQRS